MSAINLPWNIQNGDPLDADQVMANFQKIVAAVNGGLELGSNVKADDPAAPITGKDSSEGTAVTALRTDAQFIIQGVENVTAKPTTGNFLGRLVYVTAGADINKAFMCTDASTPVWDAWGNEGALDVAVHGAQHKDGGNDPLPDNIITDHMEGASAVNSAQLAAGVTNISGTTFTTIQDLAVTTTGLQTLAVAVNIRFLNTSGSKPQVSFRVRDQTAGTTIFYSIQHQLGISGGGSDAAFLSAHFFYPVPAGGPRTLRLQAGADTASAVNVSAQNGFNGESTAGACPIIQAVIV